MTTSSLPTIAAPQRTRRAAHWACAALALGALSAQAAVTQGGGADASPAALGVGTRPLDGAFGGNLTTGDRKLDLLLEAQRKPGERLPDPPAPQAVPDRPAAGRQARPASPQVPEEVRHYDSTSQAQRQPGPLGSASLPAPRATRDWHGGTVPAAEGAGGAAGPQAGEVRRLRAAAGPLREWAQEGKAFLKRHAIALALGAAAIALLALGLKAYSRRV